MSAKLKAKFDALENSRKALLDSLKKYPDELINKKPAPGKWSVEQIIEHLIIAEEFSYNYVKKKAQDTSTSKRSGFKGLRRIWVVKFFFVFPFKFKAPAVVMPVGNYATLSEMKTRWEKVRNNSYELLCSLSDEELEKELWKHAIAGKMNIYQMLDFFKIHFDKHRKQIERTVKAVRS